MWEEIAICIFGLKSQIRGKQKMSSVAQGQMERCPGVRVRASLPRRSDLGNISSWLAESCFSRAFRISDTGVSCLVAQWRIKLLMLVCQVLLQLNVLQLSLPRLLPKDFC